MLSINGVLSLLFMYNILTERKEYNKSNGRVKRNMPFMTRRLSLLLALLSTANAVDGSSYLGVYSACFVRALSFTMAQVLILIAFVWGYNIFKSSYHMVREDANLTKHKSVIIVSMVVSTAAGLYGAMKTCDGGDPQYYLFSLCAAGGLGLSLLVYVAANMYRLNRLLRDYIKHSAFDSEQLKTSLTKLRKFFWFISLFAILLEIRNTFRVLETATMTAEDKRDAEEEPFGPRDEFVFSDALFEGLFAGISILLLWYVWNRDTSGEEAKSKNTSSSGSQLPPMPLKPMKQSSSTRSSNFV